MKKTSNKAQSMLRPVRLGALLCAALILSVSSAAYAQEPAKGRLVTTAEGQPLELAKRRKTKATPKTSTETKTTETQDGEAADGEGEGADAEESATTSEQGTTSGDDAAQGQMGGGLRRGNRMEFDARLIRGETAGSGAVFLFQRAPRPLPSMVPLRTSYLHETVDQRLGERYSKNLTAAKAKALKDGVRKNSRDDQNKGSKK